MNYKKIYNNIIENRKDNPLDESEYGENHHIIPRSLGGSDDPDNLVRLSAREHFICHALLAEMYEYKSDKWYKMNHAFMMMKCSSVKNKKRYFGSRLYEYKKSDFSDVMSNLQTGEKNSQFGKVWMYSMNEKRNIKIDSSDCDIYINNGWKLGRIYDFKKKKRQQKLNSLIYKNHKYSQRSLNSINKIFDIGITIDNFNERIQDLDNHITELYHSKEFSTVDIANMYEVSDPTILSYMKKLKIPRRERYKHTERTKNKLSAPQADF